MDRETVAMILALLLAIPLWRLYHRIFTVFYRDVFWGIIGELFSAVVTGYILANIIISVLGGVLSFAFEAILFVLLLLLALAAAYLWGMIAWMIRHKINPYRDNVPQLDVKITRKDHNLLSYCAWRAAQFLHKKRDDCSFGYSILLLLLGTPCIILLLLGLFGIA